MRFTLYSLLFTLYSLLFTLYSALLIVSGFGWRQSPLVKILKDFPTPFLLFRNFSFQYILALRQITIC